MKKKYKETNLITMLKSAILVKKTSKINPKLQKAMKDGVVAYDDKYDAYYNKDTGKWLESKCGDRNCQFCGKRPKIKKL